VTVLPRFVEVALAHGKEFLIVALDEEGQLWERPETAPWRRIDKTVDPEDDA